MRVAQLTVDFRLHGCRSLKEKRSRLGRLRDKFGRSPNLVVCESSQHDSHQFGQWSFICGASDSKIVEQMLSDVERYVSEALDAEVIGMKRLWLESPHDSVAHGGVN